MSNTIFATIELVINSQTFVVLCQKPLLTKLKFFIYCAENNNLPLKKAVGGWVSISFSNEENARITIINWYLSTFLRYGIMYNIYIKRTIVLSFIAIFILTTHGAVDRGVS